MSLSRTHRPTRFKEITGQPNITETLRKQVAAGKTAHAYLFSGPRGVGKTTTARVLAKALNCERPDDGEPCGACARCRSNAEGSSIDIIEIDAASHNGVDHVRESILEHVRFTPVSNPYKLYILDEAHMLTGAAWNAMLKTLEEPPTYAIFMFATTELHKIPLTIQSRCQRYDFKRIPAEPLAARLRDLAAREGATLAPTVVDSIVRHADGCLRDAETLLGQLLTLGETNITEDVAGFVIPVSRMPRAAQLLEACASRSLPAALAEVEKLETEGIPLIPFFDDCISCIREQLLASETGDVLFSPAELSDMALLFMERRRDAKQGIDPRFAFELAVTPVALGLLPNASTTGASPRNTGANPVAIARVEPVPSNGTSTPEGISLAEVRRAWPKILQQVSEQNASLSFILTNARPERVEGNTMTIRFKFPFHKEKILEQPKNRQAVMAALERVLGIASLRLEGIVGTSDEAAVRSPTDAVSRFIHIFDGQMIDEAAES